MENWHSSMIAMAKNRNKCPC